MDIICTACSTHNGISIKIVDTANNFTAIISNHSGCSISKFNVNRNVFNIFNFYAATSNFENDITATATDVANRSVGDIYCI